MFCSVKKMTCYLLIFCMSLILPVNTFAETVEIGTDAVVSFSEPLAPKVDINLAVGETSMNLATLKEDVLTELENRNVDVSDVQFVATEQTTVSTTLSNAAQIFNSWGRIGWTGQWSYNSNTNIIVNAENTDNFTGFYYPGSFDYRNIDFSYNNGSWNGDDDVMGSMIKFNKNADGTVTTYVFFLKNHRTHGWPEYLHGGLYKIVNKPFAYASVEVLQEVDKTWPRGVWTNYRLVSKDNNIQVFMNGEQIINYTDNNDPIITGSYGFFSCSQPYAQYKDVTIVSENTKTFTEVLGETKWREGASRFVINLNEGEESAFATEALMAEVLEKFQGDGAHYIAWGNAVNKQVSTTFIEQNAEEGTFVGTEDYHAAIVKIVDFIMFHLIYEAGAGTATHPFVITNREQLLAMKYYLSGYYKLGGNVDLGGIIWHAIGSYDEPFTGHFNGSGYTISNFGWHDPSISGPLGFFGVTNNATIENVNIDQVFIHGGTYVGALIGHAIGSSTTIVNCYVGEGIVRGNNYVGGLVGKLEYGSMTTCEASVGVEGNLYVGGLVGYGYGMIIKDCTTVATVTGSEDVGGLLGFSNGNRVETCEGIATVVGHQDVGGLIGHSSGLKLKDVSFTPMIDTCTSLGNIKGSTNVGGLIGYAFYDRILDCVTSDSLEGEENVGGLLGMSESTNVDTCESSAQVEGNTNVGELIGYEL